jgi:hypothetical protein
MTKEGGASIINLAIEIATRLDAPRYRSKKRRLAEE